MSSPTPPRWGPTRASSSASGAAPGISTSPSEENMCYFNVMALGPAQSPYEGQGGEPAVPEEAEVVRHRWRPAAQEGPPPVRQVAQGHAHPAPHPQAAPQGAPGAPPVHPHPRQEPRYIRNLPVQSSLDSESTMPEVV
ncbi:hypothetical protein VPH35_018183 [Triticum aestivum]